MEGGSSSKKTKGKQKREMKKIENEKDLYTTFSKRKDGLYKKATDLKALVNADAEILMYSPSGIPYCYGNPSIESMTIPPSTMRQNVNGDIYHQLMNESKRVEFRQLEGKHDKFADQIFVEKEKKKQLERTLENKSGTSSWEINKDYENSTDFEASLVDIQNKLKNRISLHDQASDVGVGPYPAYASGSPMPEVASGENGAFLTNAINENENADAGGSGANGEFPFPPFNGHGHGYC